MSARKQRADRQAERRPHAAPAPLDLIHTNNSPNPIAMRVPGRLTFFQTLHLQRLRDEFGVDISGAENLTGPLLDEWMARAEQTLFLDLMGGLNAKT